jgi:hypothetical protein
MGHAPPQERLGRLRQQMANSNPESEQGGEELSQGRRVWYWGGLVLGIAILGIGLWLGEYYIVCVANFGTGGTSSCTFGSMEANEVIGWGITIGGVVVSTVSLVGLLWSRRNTETSTTMMQ